MPVVNYPQYLNLLRTAKEKHYGLPAINVTSTSTANAVLEGLVKAKSDGILQVSTGGGEYASGSVLKDAVVGAISIADHVRRVARDLPVQVALHTDHCPPKKIKTFLLPLIEESERRHKAGQPTLFSSHMFDGSELPLKENIRESLWLAKRCLESEMILEMEIGVVGGEEDGMKGPDVDGGKTSARLYTSPKEMLEVADKFSGMDMILVAATFGNVHGVYKPGKVKLEPKILREGQTAIKQKLGKERELCLVFHGGSGSSLEEIQETLDYGVVKMNIDTDTQYSYTRAVADYMFKNYDQILKLDGEVGSKKHYDPRVWARAAESALADRVVQAAKDLRSEGKTLQKK